MIHKVMPANIPHIGPGLSLGLVQVSLLRLQSVLDQAADGGPGAPIAPRKRVPRLSRGREPSGNQGRPSTALLAPKLQLYDGQPRNMTDSMIGMRYSIVGIPARFKHRFYLVRDRPQEGAGCRSAVFSLGTPATRRRSASQKKARPMVCKPSDGRDCVRREAGTAPADGATP